MITNRLFTDIHAPVWFTLLLLWIGASLGGAQPVSTPTSMQICEVIDAYSSPYVITLSFFLRDQNGFAIVDNPTNFQVSATENLEPLSPSETGIHLYSGNNKQFRCGVVLDYTMSMADPFINGDTNQDGKSDAIESMERSAKKLIHQVPSDANVALYEFHREDTNFPPSRVMSFTSDKQALTTAVDHIWDDVVQGFPAASRCWDALQMAIHDYNTNDVEAELRFIIFISDGQDESSTATVEEVIGAANARGIRIFGVGFGQELRTVDLNKITSETGGALFIAEDAVSLEQRFATISYELGGHYILRWATLKRSNERVSPKFVIQYGDITSSYEPDDYWPTNMYGNVLEGQLFFNGSVNNRGDASLTLNAYYMPRYITKLRLKYASLYPFTVSKVLPQDGGLCPESWQLVQSNNCDVGWIELSSPNPKNNFTALPFASLGKLLRFDFHGQTNLTNLAQCFYSLEIDTNLYTINQQSFLISNTNSVSQRLEDLPMGTKIWWVQKYGITNDYLHAELADLDGDGHALWQEFIAGTDPTNQVSSLAIKNLRFQNRTCQVDFASQTNRSYRIEYSEDLQSWRTLTNDVVGTGKPISLTLTNQNKNKNASGYFRVGITAWTNLQIEIPGLMWLPAGSFLMGNPDSGMISTPWQGPCQQVTLTQGFWMRQYEVTNAEYQAVMGLSSQDPTEVTRSVTWNEARLFCARLTWYETQAGRLPPGYEYRLPTEAEWEYACRAGTTTHFSYGDNPLILGDYASYQDNSAEAPELPGLKKPNPWGLYDMHGNVCEWCYDIFGSLSGGNVTNPIGPTSGDMMVIRGGGYYSPYNECQSDYRWMYPPEASGPDIGFRVVLARPIP